MKTKSSIFLVVFFLLLVNAATAQVIYEPIHSNVYDFLERMSVKGIINYYDIIKPLPRTELAGYLKEIEKKSDLLTTVEKQELNWYEIDYSYEIKGEPDRWRVFEYADTLFHVYLTPIVELKYNSIGGKSSWKRSWLGRFDGSIGDNIGFSFSITDNSEGGDSVDADKSFSPLTGFNHKTSKDGSISYEDINATLNYNWSWGTFTFGKDFVNWGSGRSGQLILSSKAPSFPFIKFDIHPVSWLRFQYLHGWLASNVADSSSFYITSGVDSDGNPRYRGSQRSKYIAANLLSIMPGKNIIFSLGNSIIYSDGSVRAPFLIPFIWYYKGIDHNFYGSTQDDGYGNNGQMFFDLSVKTLKNYHFYGTLFIDEFSLTNFLKGNHSRDQLGYTIGITNYSSIIDNLMLGVEYTKIMPGTYLNYIQTQTYAHDNYPLGHWIGQNADELYLNMSYQIMRGMNIKLDFDRVRKGGDQLGTGFSGPMSFLYKPLSKYTGFGAALNYQPIYDLNVRAKLKRTKYEYNDGTNPATETSNWTFGIDLSYGIY